MAKEEKIKLTEISVPKGWKYLPFGDVFEFIQSNALSREQLTFDEHEGEIFNIHYGDIHSTYKTDLLDLDKEQKVPRIKDIVESKSLAFLKDGDLIIADASEDYEGVAANLELKNIKKKKVTGGLHTFVARDNSGLTVQGFRTYILKNPAITTNLKKLATGSKVYGVSKTNLATLKVLLPPGKEQIKIAKILSTWDVTIETLEQLIAKKERNKKALMQLLLKGKIRFKEFKGEKVKTYNIKDVFEIKAGKDIDNTKFSLIENSVFKYPVYSNTLENKGLYGFYNSFQYDQGYVTVTARGGVGHANPRFEKFNAIGRLLILKPKDFIDHVYASEYINTCINIHIESTGVPQLTAPQFGVYRIAAPSLKEQKKIASVLLTADKELDILKIQLQHYKKQKQGLMQLLLTGQKRVKV